MVRTFLTKTYIQKGQRNKGMRRCRVGAGESTVSALTLLMSASRTSQDTLVRGLFLAGAARHLCPCWFRAD